MTVSTTIALFGGTFNPPHNGHLMPIIELLDELNLSQIRYLPAQQPPHKEPLCTATEHRIAMLKLLCQNDPRLMVDETELSLAAPSYTVKTLAHIRQQHPHASILFIMGEDSLLQLDSWYEWQQLTELAHLVVMPRKMPRNTVKASKQLQHWLKSTTTKNTDVLFQHAHGAVFFAETPLWDVSSTQLRHAFANGDSDPTLSTNLKSWLPADVSQYIKLNHLYNYSQ